MIALYNILLITGIIIGSPFIIPIVLLSGKRRKTFLPRLGLKSLPKEINKNRSRASGKKAIWIHALSVGETLAAVPLIEEVKDRFINREIYFSVSTQTGFEIAHSILKETADAIFFFPYDLLFSVKYIIKKINPALVIIVESDIWPNFLFEANSRNIPVVLANARLSQRSFLGYRRFSFFTKRLFLSFSKVCTQSAGDANRFRSLGVPSKRIVLTGNVKFDQAFEQMPEEEVSELRQSINILPSQRVLLAGSTHKGEEPILFDAFSRLKKEFDDLLLIIAPRDPKRAGSVNRISESWDFSTILMTELSRSEPGKRYDVIVIDAIGFLKQLYTLADIAFIGGSLVRAGGHNPLEPAAFAKPILFGPDMGDFAQMSQLLEIAGGAVTVRDAGDIYRQAGMLLNDNQKAKKMGENAFNVLLENKGAVAKTLEVLKCYL